MALHRCTTSGFTILEMMVVMGVLAVLFGLGFGFLQGAANDLELAEAVLRDQVRIASLTSRSRHLPTEVRVQSGEEGGVVRLRAQVLASVGHWHLEPGERWLNEAMTPVLEGKFVPGRYGYAMRPDPTAMAMLSLETSGKPYLNLEDGFSVRVDVKLEARQRMSIFRLGEAIEIGLDSDLKPFGRVLIRGPSGIAAGSVLVADERALSLDRWHDLQLILDGHSLQLVVDDRLAGATSAAVRIMQTGEEVLLVSPIDSPVIGLIDEIQLLAYEYAQTQALPVGIELRGHERGIRFDRYGEPVTHLLLTLLDVADGARELRLGPGGVIE